MITADPRQVGTWILTQSGGRIPVHKPMPRDIRFPDIAFGLSHICRWVGQTSDFYSVAEHSLLVEAEAPLEANATERLQALLHDAPEAYLGDVSWPTKQLMPSYWTLEKVWGEAIAVAFNLPAELPRWIQEADTAVAVAEAGALLPPEAQRTVHEVCRNVDPPDCVIQCLTPRVVRVLFTERFKELLEEVL